jgi:hypothetical protein
MRYLTHQLPRVNASRDNDNPDVGLNYLRGISAKQALYYSKACSGAHRGLFLIFTNFLRALVMSRRRPNGCFGAVGTNRSRHRFSP